MSLFYLNFECVFVFEVVFNSVILLLFLLLCMVGVKCELFVSLLFNFIYLFFGPGR